MVKIISDAEFETAIASGVSVVDFSAEWCGPCKMLGPVMEELSEKMQDVAFYNIDVDANPETAKNMRIMSIPAVFVFKDGELVDSSIGFQPQDAMEAFINQCK